MLTESEAAAAAALVCPSTIILLAWLADGARLRLDPIVVLAASASVSAVVVTAITRARSGWRVTFAASRFSAFIAVVLTFFVYVCWLRWPSLLPAGEGPDLTHHLMLIHFIQRRGALPHDPLLGAVYLGEMNTYTPGSHLVAAVLANALRVDGVRLVHPLMAAFVALKAGVVYNILLRFIRQDRAAPPVALAGTLLLLVPHAYLLQPLTFYGFYSQVIADTFALALLWASVAWFHRPSIWAGVLFALFGGAVVLCWPVWLAIPAMTFVIVVLATRSIPASLRALHLAVGLAPVAVLALVYSTRHVASAGILSSGGSVLTPHVRLLGWPFLALALTGTIVAVRRGAAMLPLLAFGAVCIAQIIGLAALQRSLGASNLYLPFKTIHLLVYPAVILAGIALDTLARGRRRMLVSALMVVAVPLWAWSRDLPRRPVHSPLTEPVYRAGLWTKAHLPPQCIDYIVKDWVTGYWLHVDVLGNARASDRMRHESFAYTETVGRWIDGPSLPFAIVEDMESLPRDVRPNLRVLQQFGPGAVVARADGRGECRDRTPPIDEFESQRK